MVPVGYRKALGLKPGDVVILVLEDGEMRIVTIRKAVQRAQELVRQYVPEGRDLAGELVREWREESDGG